VDGLEQLQVKLLEADLQQGLIGFKGVAVQVIEHFVHQLSERRETFPVVDVGLQQLLP
jgi:hypothetical protein